VNNEEDDIEQFITEMVVQPPPPFNISDTSCADNVNNNVVVVTSAVTSYHNVNNGNSAVSNATSYPRAGCIDKAADSLYVNLPEQRLTELLPEPLPVLPDCSAFANHYVNVDLQRDGRLQTTNEGHCGFNRPHVRWYDHHDASYSYDCQHSSVNDRTGQQNLAVCTTTMRPISLQHE